MLILCTPLIHFVKARVPVPSLSLPRRPISLSFLTSRVFLSFQLGNILESLGFFLPSIYLPSYARALHLPPTTCSLLLAFLNGSSIAGAIVMGHLCDLFPVTFIIALSTLSASLSVFLLWGLSSSLPSLLLFASLYGLSAGGFSAIWTGMMRAVQRADPLATLATLMGLFSAGRGIGAVLSGPLSELLLAAEPLRGAPAAYASPYGPLILFTGVSALLDLVCLGAGRHRT
jgi:MFS family permease